MTNKTSSIERKAEQAAQKHFEAYEHAQQLAVIHKGNTDAQVSIFSREDGQQTSVSFPLDQDLEYCAQELLYRFGSTRKDIVYV